MCGIGGYLGNFDCSRLPAMAARLAHRGPDDEGIYHNSAKKLGLVHRRLAIQDLSDAGHQPMWEQNNQVCIVFNGEIYNFPELKKELESEGFSFRSNSDTEVILILYLRYGVKLLSRLNGIYAFAIWDARKNSLFIARDGLGVKPLYFSEISEGFVFASEIKALLVHDQIKRRLNPKAIAAHLTFLWSPAPDTAMLGVKKLEPGFAMEVKEGRIIRHWRHYDLPYGNQTIFDGSEDEAIELVTNSLRTAVKRQLISDVPIGAFLSGGLDSSSIVALAHKINGGDNIPCFTIGIEGVSENKDGVVADLPYAQRVASHLGVSLDTIWTTPYSMIDRLEEMIWHLDEPQADPAALNALFISELAYSKGIKVLLSGAGGDDIFTGYRRHWALNQERHWHGIPRFIRSYAGAMSQYLPVSNPKLRRIAKAMRYMGKNADERIASYFYWLDPAQSLNLLHPDLKAQLVETDVSQALMDSLQCVENEPERLNKMLYLEAKYFLADHNLSYTDKVSMATGVEVRVPLLDPDLILLATQLPVHMKQRGKEGKWIFKRAMEPYLPNDVIYRPKTGFGVPLRRWLREELSSVVEELLSESSLTARGVFDPKAVKKLILDDKAGRIDATYSIFGLICIEMWCRRFIDR
ncbi:MAG: asparagine synthase (glutamine-hydrolyzing) [Gammaproteobacteria bacterium]|nr:asparagine synthase (glutamine-hydrolyzing) [Gammaproteobacteria bacterium]